MDTENIFLHFPVTNIGLIFFRQSILIIGGLPRNGMLNYITNPKTANYER